MTHYEKSLVAAARGINVEVGGFFEAAGVPVQVKVVDCGQYGMATFLDGRPFLQEVYDRCYWAVGGTKWWNPYVRWIPPDMRQELALAVYRRWVENHRRGRMWQEEVFFVVEDMGKEGVFDPFPWGTVTGIMAD